MLMNNTLSRDEIKEMISSWQLNEAAELALKDKNVLRVLISLARDKDMNTQIRALLALREVIRVGGDRVKIEIMRQGFGTLLSALESGEPRIISKALKVLTELIDGFPLKKEEFLALVDVLVELIQNPRMNMTYMELSELIPKITAAQPSPAIRSKVSWLMSNDNPFLAAMGFRLLLNIFVFTGDVKSLVILLNEIIDFTPGENNLLQDFILDLVSEMVDRKLPAEVINLLPKLLIKVRWQREHTKDPLIRAKVEKVIKRVEGILADYYRSRPEEGKKFLNKLVIEGEHELAMDLAISLGDDFLIRWIQRRIKSRGTGEFTSAAMVVSGPKVGLSGAVSFSPPTSHKEHRKTHLQAETDESAPLAKLMEEGNASVVADLLCSSEEAVTQTSGLLRSGDFETRSNTLWVLSKVVSLLDGEELRKLAPLVPALCDVLKSGNPWERSKTAKILATLTWKGGVEDVLERVFRLIDEKPLAAMEFFGYYFVHASDKDTALKLLDVLRKLLNEQNARFQALMVLNAMTAGGSWPIEGLGEFKQILQSILKSGDEDSAKIAFRILERFKEDTN